MKVQILRYIISASSKYVDSFSHLLFSHPLIEVPTLILVPIFWISHHGQARIDHVPCVCFKQWDEHCLTVTSTNYNYLIIKCLALLLLLISSSLNISKAYQSEQQVILSLPTWNPMHHHSQSNVFQLPTKATVELVSLSIPETGWAWPGVGHWGAVAIFTCFPFRPHIYFVHGNTNGYDRVHYLKFGYLLSQPVHFFPLHLCAAQLVI